jgi:hypothetical protein
MWVAFIEDISIMGATAPNAELVISGTYERIKGELICSQEADLPGVQKAVLEVLGQVDGAETTTIW